MARISTEGISLLIDQLGSPDEAGRIVTAALRHGATSADTTMRGERNYGVTVRFPAMDGDGIAVGIPKFLADEVDASLPEKVHAAFGTS